MNCMAHIQDVDSLMTVFIRDIDENTVVRQCYICAVHDYCTNVTIGQIQTLLMYLLPSSMIYGSGHRCDYEYIFFYVSCVDDVRRVTVTDSPVMCKQRGSQNGWLM